MPVQTQRPAQPDSGRAYTKRLRWSGELRFLTFFLAILAYSLTGIHKSSVATAEAITGNFYLQTLLCWIPLWAVCAVASLPVSVYRFYLDRKFQLVKSDVRRWLWDCFKANILAFVLGASIIEAAFSSNTLVPAYGWIVAGILCSLLFVAVNRSMP